MAAPTVLALFECPRCSHRVEALPGATASHWCPTVRRLVTFVKVEPADA